MKLSGFHKFKKKMIPVGGLLCSGMILGGLCFPGWGWGEPPPSPAPPPESLVSPPPATLQAVSPSKSAEETLWLPLRKIIQRYSETTGNRIKISGALQTEDKLFDQVFSAEDPSWLEDFNRMEILDEQTGKKEIILLGIRDGSGLITKTAQKKYRGKFSRSKTPGVSGQAEDKQKRKRRVRSPFSRRSKK